MNPRISSLLKKATLFTGILFLGWAAKAQSTGNDNMRSDTTHRHSGMQRRWGARNGSDSLAGRNAFRRGPGGQDRFRPGGGPGGKDWAFRGQRGNFRGREGGGGRNGFRRGWAGRGPGVRYTPEQRKQLMAINKEYYQKSEDLFKKDNITLKEYKSGLVALQNEKKAKLEALLTPGQKEEMAARKKRMSENTRVMAAAQMERLKIRLNLSDDQVAKIKAGQESLHTQATAIRDNTSLLPQQKREQMMSLMARRKDIVKSVLTPEQQTQFEKMSQRRFGGPGGRGGRGRMGGFGGDHRPGGNMDDQSK
jgi:hypothetical protein